MPTHATSQASPSGPGQLAGTASWQPPQRQLPSRWELRPLAAHPAGVLLPAEPQSEPRLPAAGREPARQTRVCTAVQHAAAGCTDRFSPQAPGWSLQPAYLAVGSGCAVCLVKEDVEQDQVGIRGGWPSRGMCSAAVGLGQAQAGQPYYALSAPRKSPAAGVNSSDVECKGEPAASDPSSRDPPCSPSYPACKRRRA